MGSLLKFSLLGQMIFKFFSHTVSELCTVIKITSNNIWKTAESGYLCNPKSREAGAE